MTKPQTRGAPRKVDTATVRILYGRFRAEGQSNVGAIALLAQQFAVTAKTIRNCLGDAEQRRALAAHIHVVRKPWPRRKTPEAD